MTDNTEALPPLLTERQIVDCIAEAGCFGTVKLTYESGPYEITRTTVNSDKLARAIERKVRAALAQRQQVPYGWSDADADAARLALELECMLTDKDVPTSTVSRWWDSAHEALDLHRKRVAALTAAPSAQAEPQVPPRSAPLTFDQLHSVMSQHFGGRELTDAEADSAEAFARAIERAHGICKKEGST